MISKEFPDCPKIGGLIDVNKGKEAWNGGKPLGDWSGIDPISNMIQIPIQIRLVSSRAATALIKHTKGLFTEESLRLKHGDNLD